MRWLVVVLVFAASAVVAEHGDEPSRVATRLGFSAGEAPVDVGDGARSLSARECGRCHQADYEAWRRSRHARATLNPLFAHGHALEPGPRCVNCHAPLAQQTAGVHKGRVAPGSLAEEGVTCAVCHVRNDEVLTARDPALAPPLARRAHTLRHEPALASAQMCAACHQFRCRGDAPPDARGLVQSTYDEWLGYRRAGGERDCAGCHMPSGDHAFPRGGYDTDALVGALTARVEGGSLHLASRGVGHDLPTGDLYRHLLVEARVAEGWQEVARLGRTFETVTGPDGRRRRERVTDTALSPGEEVVLGLPEGAREVAVRYVRTHPGYVRRLRERGADVVRTLAVLPVNAPSGP
jgi:hypothetical protein